MTAGSVLDDAGDDTDESGGTSAERSPAVAHPASNTATSNKPPVDRERSIAETYSDEGHARPTGASIYCVSSVLAAMQVRAYDRRVVELRLMSIDDVAFLVRWDDDPDVAAAIGGRGADWYDWPSELIRDVPWRELLIAEEDGRPIGFVQLIDACEEESHYWGEIEPGTWALDIWIGSPDDRGRGLGAEVIKVALGRVFEHHGAETLVIDPVVGNRRAISFYERLGFERIGVREFDDHESLVMHLRRGSAD